jgi:membrane fusion protein, heavy metal efflux system
MRRIGFLILPVAFFSAWGCGSSPEQKAAASPAVAAGAAETYVPKDAKGIQTIKVEPRAIPDYLEMPGRVVPDPTQVVHVYPAAGGRVTEMKVRPWDRVQKGDTLALLDSADASRAVADYAKARTDAELKKKALERAVDLFGHKALAEKDLQQAQADAEAASAELNANLDRLRVLGVDPASPTPQLKVLAPRSGVVLDVGTAAGELSKSLDAASQPLCTLADLSTVWVEGQVFEKDVSGLRTGAPAEVRVNAYPNEKWSGRVAVVSDAVDPVTRTMNVRVVLSNPNLRLKPGMFATVRLLRSTSQGIVVPVASVIREGTDAYVFVAAGEQRFVRRTVKLGRTLDSSAEILSGLNAGDTIVSDGALLVNAAQSANP